MSVGFYIYYKYDHEDRLRNMRVVTNYLNELNLGKVVVCSDINHKPTRDNIFGLHPETTVVFSKTNTSKAASINRAVKLINTDICFIYDADVILHPVQLQAAIKLLADNKQDHVYPFDGRFVCLSKTYTDKLFCETKTSQDIITLIGQWYAMLQNLHPDLAIAHESSPGGCTGMTRRVFDRLGGLDENFVGWGFEDTALKALSVKQENRVCYIPGVLWHLNHEGAVRENSNTYKDNMARFFDHYAA